MQPVFANDEALRKAFLTNLSTPRFSTYLKIAHGDERHAIALYHWNTRLSQSLGVCAQAWEVCLRNRLAELLRTRLNPSWPYHPDARRQLKPRDRKRLDEAVERQEQERGKPAPLSAIIADLSAGFWVSLLGSGYDVPLIWRRNVEIVFPNDDDLTIGDAHTISEEALKLRNRIAHHEPILHLPLDERRKRMGTLIRSMCLGTHAYVEETCTFASVWNDSPMKPPMKPPVVDEIAEPLDEDAAKAVPTVGE